MSTKSRVAQTLQGLQRVVDQMEDDSCCPTTLLRTLDYALLTDGEVSIRKAALLSLFILVKASMAKPPQSKLLHPLHAPLIIKNDLIYLAVASGDEGLVKFHTMLKATTKLRPDFLGKNLFGYHQINSNSGSMLGVEATKKGKYLVLTECLDLIPDPATCRVFCKMTPRWQTDVGLAYMRAGGGSEEVPTCSSSSSSRSSSSDSCKSLDSLDADFCRLPVKHKGRIHLRRKSTAEFYMEQEAQPELENKKFVTTGHFDKVVIEAEQSKIRQEIVLEKSISALREKKEESRFIIRHKKSSLGICKISNSLQKKSEKTTAGPFSTQDQYPMNPDVRSRNIFRRQNPVLPIFIRSPVCTNFIIQQQAKKLSIELVGDNFEFPKQRKILILKKA